MASLNEQCCLSVSWGQCVSGGGAGQVCGVHGGKWEARRVDASSPTPSASALSPHHGEHLRGGGYPAASSCPSQHSALCA